MKKSYLVKCFCRSLLLAVSLVTSASAASIGLNLVGQDNPGTSGALSLPSTLSAGVVPQTNWNNLPGNNTNNVAQSVTIVDNLGNSTAVGVSWVSLTPYSNSSTSLTNPSLTNGDQILNNGGIWGATPRPAVPSVTVTNIPYANYEVIVTSLLDHGGTIISTTLVGGPTYYANQTQNPQDTGYIDGTSTGFTYTQSTDMSGVGTPLGDYALFTNLSASSFTVKEDIVSGVATAANLSSIQIVQVVPEPSTVVLLGLGVVGLFATIRGRCKA